MSNTQTKLHKRERVLTAAKQKQPRGGPSHLKNFPVSHWHRASAPPQRTLAELRRWARDSPSGALHEANWRVIMERFSAFAKAAATKRALAEDEVLSVDERNALQRAEMLGKRRRDVPGVASLGASGSPEKLWKAMLGKIIPVLGSYATSLAMEWLNPEIKFIVTSFNATTDWLTTPMVQLCNGMAQGVDYDERVGNSIRIIGVEIDLTIVRNPTYSSTIVGQVICLVDTQTEGAVPPTADVFESGVTLLAFAAAPNFLTAPDRFAFLHREHFTVGSAVAAPAAPTVFGLARPTHKVTARVDLVHQQMHTLYQGTGATVASISKGSIYLVGVSSEATNGPVVYGHVRIVYEDN